MINMSSWAHRAFCHILYFGRRPLYLNRASLPRDALTAAQVVDLEAENSALRAMVQHLLDSHKASNLFLRNSFQICKNSAEVCNVHFKL